MATESDRRGTARQECLLGATYLPAGDADRYLAALVQDVSPHGASLLVPRAAEVGERLTLQLQRWGRGPAVRRELEIRFVRPFGISAWTVGGVFDRPLEPDEYQRLR